MTNQSLLKEFRIILKREGLKFTPQRVAVLEDVIGDDGHRECEDIYLALKKNGKHVSRATVYRTMDILVQNNFARKIEFGDGRARYESKVDSHHHDKMVCTLCGNIEEFLDENIQFKETPEGWYSIDGKDKEWCVMELGQFGNLEENYHDCVGKSAARAEFNNLL